MKQAITLREQGKTVQTIADMLDTSYNKVYYYLLRHGLAGNKQARESPIDYEELYEWFSSGGNIRQFCITKGIARSTYFHYMTRDYGSTDKQEFMREYAKFI